MTKIAEPESKGNGHETSLTPELAAQLLSKRHPRQRRPGRQMVMEYARRIKEGRWRLIPDPIMVDGEGRLFNGGHRCEAVIQANRPIPVYIMWDADPALFDVIDVGRFRSPYQFITEGDATARASAARITLWYQRRFDRPLLPRHLGFDLHEILEEAERLAEPFDAVSAAIRTIYEYTSIAKSVSMAAFALAFEMGYHSEVEAFVEGIREPHVLGEEDPVRLLAERFRKEQHRSKRRQLVDDWTLLVYTFNLQLEGRTLSKLILSDVWPRVAELTTEYRKRQNVIHKGRYSVRRRNAQGAEYSRKQTA